MDYQAYIGKKASYLTINTSDRAMFISYANITNLEYVKRESYEAISFIADNAVVIARGTNIEKLPKLLMDWQVSELTEFDKEAHTNPPDDNAIITHIIIDHMEAWRNKVSDN